MSTQVSPLPFFSLRYACGMNWRVERRLTQAAMFATVSAPQVVKTSGMSLPVRSKATPPRAMPLPEEQRAASRRFAGALLAEVEPAAPEVTSYVKEFKTYTESRVTMSVNYDASLTPDKVYAFGSEPFTSIDLGKVDPAKVTAFETPGGAFRRVWVGSTLLVTPQHRQGSAVFVRKDPTGLGLEPAIWSANNEGVIKLDLNVGEVHLQ
jgi:hypothetical protein